MALSNCQGCGQLFNKIAIGLCQACLDKIEEDFEKVFSYLKAHGAANVDLLHAETGVEKKRIMKFLAEGRFEGISVSYKCENCGASITGGKLCSVCICKISQELQQIQKKASPKPPETNKGEVHTSLDRYKTK